MQPTRRFVLAAVAAAAAGPATAQQRIGLAERRGLAAYQEQVLPGLVQQINEAAGYDLPLEIDWNAIALAVVGHGERYTEPEFFTDIYFRPLIEALRAITRDAMGREALKSALKRVVFTYNAETAPVSNYPTGVSFADGTLRINFRPWANAADVTPRARAIQQLLERNL
jgi:hypothetical protein